jgi:hypothetical protein
VPVPVKLLLRRSAELTLLLALLLGPWPGLDRAFCATFCGFVNALGLERQLDSGLLTRFEPAAPGSLESARAHEGWHAMLRVENPSTARATRLGFNTRSTTYLPAVTFLAFTLASRAWRRTRAWAAIGAGALVVFSFSALALTLSVIRFLALPRVSGIELGDGTVALLDAVFRAWIVPPGMAYAVPLLSGCWTLWLSRPREPAEAMRRFGDDPETRAH